MIEKKRRRPYWRRTKLALFMALALPCTLMVLAPYIAGLLDAYRFMNFPLGYMVTAHGTVLVAVYAVARFIMRQDTLDRWHGAHEDY